MSTPISLHNIQQDTVSNIDQSDLSKTGKIERPSDRLDSEQLNGESIVAMLNMIMLYLQKYASWMRDKNLNTAAEVAGQGMKGALDALDKTLKSAETELSAKQNIFNWQIGAGVAGIGITVLGGFAAAGAFSGNGEAILGTGMLTNGISGGFSSILTSGAERYSAGDLTRANIEKAQADNQRQLLPILETVRSWLDNLGGQMTNQFQQINSTVMDIARGFSRFFEAPIS